MRDFSVLYPEVLAAKGAGRHQSVFRHQVDVRNVYRIALPLAILALLPSLLTGPLDPFNRIMLPIVGMVLVFVLLSSFRENVSLNVMNVVLLGIAWLELLGHISYRMWTLAPGSLSAGLGGSPWFVVLLVAHQWMLGDRLGRRVSSLVLLIFALLTAVFLLNHPVAWRGSGVSLLQTLMAGLVAMGIQQVTLERLRSDARQGPLPQLDMQNRDALTGLPDHQAVRRLLVQNFNRRAAGLAVGVISLDQLPQITRQHGELFAEHLRAHVSRVLTDTVRDEDIVGVLSHAEFVVIVRVPDSRAAKAALERLRVRVASRPLEGVNPSVSIGVAFHAGHADALALLEEAQLALRAAQREGVNRVKLAEPGNVSDPALAAS